MFGSPILEVAIGLAFVYLWLSAICSGLNEWLAKRLNLRARMLEEALQNLFNDPGAAQKIYGNPLIQGLARGQGRPSYIPAHLFAQAWLDWVQPGAQTVQEVRAGMHQLLERLRVKEEKDLEPEEKAVFGMHKCLSALIDSAQDDLQKLRRNMERWFDDAMERVSGWYKRESKKFILIWALLLTVLLNADSLKIARTLYQDSALRTAVALSAQEAIHTGKPEELPASLNAVKGQLRLPLGWSRESLDFLADFLGLKRTETGEEAGEGALDKTDALWIILRKILGLGFTTFALCLGAPFWFDLINKLINLRAGGKPPETKPQEGS